jgi:hypothetical protein
MLVILVNREVDKKRIVRKNGRPRRRSHKESLTPKKLSSLIRCRQFLNLNFLGGVNLVDCVQIFGKTKESFEWPDDQVKQALKNILIVFLK